MRMQQPFKVESFLCRMSQLQPFKLKFSGWLKEISCSFKHDCCNSNCSNLKLKKSHCLKSQVIQFLADSQSLANWSLYLKHLQSNGCQVSKATIGIRRIELMFLFRFLEKDCWSEYRFYTLYNVCLYRLIFTYIMYKSTKCPPSWSSVLPHVYKKLGSI